MQAGVLREIIDEAVGLTSNSIADDDQREVTIVQSARDPISKLRFVEIGLILPSDLEENIPFPAQPSTDLPLQIRVGERVEFCSVL